MSILAELPTRSETEHADAARDEAERGPEPPPMDWDHFVEVNKMVDVEEETE